MDSPSHRNPWPVSIALVLGGLILALAAFAQAQPPFPPFPPHALPGDAGSFPAVGDQTEPSIASRGDGFLIVWTDERSTVLEGGGTGRDVYAARLDASGALIDTTPIAITRAPGDQYEPRAAWNGQNWLVIWTGTVPAFPIPRHNTEGVRLSGGGVVLDADPMEIWYHGDNSEHVVGLASDGQDWAVVVTDVYVSGLATKTRLVGKRVTAAGAVLSATSYLFSPSCCYVFYKAGMAYADGIYMVVFEGYVSGSEYGIFGLRLSPGLTTLDSYPVELVTIPMQGETHYYRTPDVTSNGSQFFVGWQLYISDTSSQVWGARVDANGQSLDGDGMAVSDPLPLSLNLQPDVAWDGTQWVLGWPQDGQERLARVGAAGTVVDPGGVPTGLPAGLSYAGGGAGLQVAWSDDRNGGTQPGDVFTATMDPDLVLGPDACASLGAPAQLHADIERGNQGALVAYASAIAGETRVMAHLLDDRGEAAAPDPVQLAGGAAEQPRVAFAGDQYLVVWNDLDLAAVRGVRIDESGAVLDATPLELLPGSGADVAGRDGEFLVVAADAAGAHAVRVAADGSVLDAPALTLAAGSVGAPRAGSLGAYWLATWERLGGADGGEVEYCAVDASGLVIGPIPVTTPADGIAAHGPVVAGGDVALIAWQDSRNADADLFGRRVSSTLTFTDPAAGLPINTAAGDQSDAAVAWDGTRFVLAFADTRDRAGELDESLAVYRTWLAPMGPVDDPDGVALLSGDTTAGQPTLTGAVGNQIYAASVFDATASHGAYRLQLSFAGLPTAAGDTPSATRLLALYPNPANPAVNVRFTLARAGAVVVDIYDLRGARVRQLQASQLAAGRHELVWNGRDDGGRGAPSGTYLVRIRAGGIEQTGRVALVK